MAGTQPLDSPKGSGIPGTLILDLVSPEKLLLSESVSMAVIPGSEGDFGVLPGHVPLIATLRPGVIDIYTGGAYPAATVTSRIFVAGGFAEVTGERCTVLAEEVIKVADLDRPATELAIKNLSEDLALAKPGHDYDVVEVKLKIAKAKLQAITGQIVV